VTDAMLVLAGPCDEDYRRVVDHAIDASGIRERVIFTGMLRGAEKFAALVDADLFVLPSYQENFGNVVIESLAAGTPVVISDQVNLQSQIAAARVGEVVPLDAGPLAAAIERWLRDPQLRGEAVARAKPFVAQNFDWRKIGRDWMQLYQEIRGKGVAPVRAT
jgi:glycosyltransferase involved in cell wall biosynthesis